MDLNGRVINGSNAPCPFLYQGQYYDKEIELAYNRFRYYDPDDGRYISKDPIGLLSGEYGFYNYVGDSNGWIDVLGLGSHLDSAITFTDSAGTTLTANGYTDLSHMSDTKLKQMEYMNTHKGGKSPVDKHNNLIIGHHYKQQAAGPIVMIPAKHHDKKHTNAPTSNGRSGQHPNGKRAGGGLTKAERKAFDSWRKEFYAHLASNELNKRKKNSYNK
ncbi:RHS repeat-associated core domain-containing protein [Tenacibaculum maritimum]|uniref:RHS repeat-associated core domain-containing protein n=2 Tax=Tenacibaculum maritimum TaxID=107401 RepID=UPI0021D41DA9|nr:RHS repeat-associated core domain-containing protein [Tenacibaculum maritimum]